MMGEHGLWSKMTFYEDSVRIPLVIVPPAHRNAGACCEAPVSLIDWMTTVLELSGQQSYFENLPGRSLVQLIENPTRQWADRAIISDYACDGTRVPMRMVRRGRWKAWFAPPFPPVLFDLQNDPHEWDDLGPEPSSKDTLEELRAVARSDGWRPEVLRNEILLHKRRLKYISEAEKDLPASLALRGGEKMINPYEGVNWQSAIKVPSATHMHIVNQENLDNGYRYGVRHFPISNYYPSAPYDANTRLSDFRLRQWWGTVRDGRRLDPPINWNDIITWEHELEESYRTDFPFAETEPVYTDIPEDVILSRNAEHHGFTNSRAHICSVSVLQTA